MPPDDDDDDIVVFQIRRRDSSCDSCGEQLGPGRQIRLIESGDGEDHAHCLSCAGLDDLVFVPTGDHRLSRRVRTRSERQAVVVKWARARERYERRGYLIEEPVVEAVLEEFNEEGYDPKLELQDERWVRRD